MLRNSIHCKKRVKTPFFYTTQTNQLPIIQINGSKEVSDHEQQKLLVQNTGFLWSPIHFISLSFLGTFLDNLYVNISRVLCHCFFVNRVVTYVLHSNLIEIGVDDKYCKLPIWIIFLLYQVKAWVSNAFVTFLIHFYLTKVSIYKK